MWLIGQLVNSHDTQFRRNLFENEDARCHGNGSANEIIDGAVTNWQK